MDRDSKISNARIESTKELLHTFFTLADEWGLAIEDQKNLLGEDTWLKLSYQIDSNVDAAVNDNAIARLVLLKTLRLKIDQVRSNVTAEDYLRTGVEYLDGKTPLSVMLENPDTGLFALNRILMVMTRSAEPVFN